MDNKKFSKRKWSGIACTAKEIMLELNVEDLKTATISDSKIMANFNQKPTTHSLPSNKDNDLVNKFFPD